MDRNQPFKKYPHNSDKKVEVPMHSHSNGQINYVTKGTVRLMTVNASWIVPEKRLIWIPPDQPHSVRCLDLSGGWKAMIPRPFGRFLPKEVCVLRSSALLTASLEALPEYTEAFSKDRTRLLTALIKLELQVAKREQFGVKLPNSARLKAVCDVLVEHPEDPRRIDDWAAMVGMSRRTFTRFFVAETGHSFGAWKRMLVLEKALQLLGNGLSVNETSDRLGYAEPSAFVAAFRRRFGTTPGQYFNG